jgi:hypothetical protein
VKHDGGFAAQAAISLFFDHAPQPFAPFMLSPQRKLWANGKLPLRPVQN